MPQVPGSEGGDQNFPVLGGSEEGVRGTFLSGDKKSRPRCYCTGPIEEREGPREGEKINPEEELHRTRGGGPVEGRETCLHEERICRV